MAVSSPALDAWPAPLPEGDAEAIIRLPAIELQPDNDLGTRLVTRAVGALGESEIEAALEAGASRARQLLVAGLIEGAALRLLGETALVGSTGIRSSALPALHQGAEGTACV